MNKRAREFECKNDPDIFCFICGEFTVKRMRRVFSNPLKFAYHKCYGIEPRNNEKPWTPNTVCTTCRVELIFSETGTKRRHMKFITPMNGNLMEGTYASVSTVSLPELNSTEATLPESNLTLVPAPLSLSTAVSDYAASCCTALQTENERNPLSQAQLNDWIRDLELSKENAELHASRMQQFKFVSSDVKVTYYRTRHEQLSQYYAKKNSVCYCKNIAGLFKQFGEPYDSKEWRLFIDGNKLRLKAVLLHIGNQKPSIPIAHAVNTKETYETMQKLLKLIKYEEHDWKIQGG